MSQELISKKSSGGSTDELETFNTQLGKTQGHSSIGTAGIWADARTKFNSGNVRDVRFFQNKIPTIGRAISMDLHFSMSANGDRAFGHCSPYVKSVQTRAEVFFTVVAEGEGLYVTMSNSPSAGERARRGGVTAISPDSEIRVFLAATPTGTKARIGYNDVGKDWQMFTDYGPEFNNVRTDRNFLAVNNDGEVLSLTDVNDSPSVRYTASSGIFDSIGTIGGGNTPIGLGMTTANEFMYMRSGIDSLFYGTNRTGWNAVALAEGLLGDYVALDGKRERVLNYKHITSGTDRVIEAKYFMIPENDVELLRYDLTESDKVLMPTLATYCHVSANMSPDGRYVVFLLAENNNSPATAIIGYDAVEGTWTKFRKVPTPSLCGGYTDYHSHEPGKIVVFNNGCFIAPQFLETGGSYTLLTGTIAETVADLLPESGKETLKTFY